jgi:integrase
VVANPIQVRALLIGVASVGSRIKDRGLRLVAFLRLYVPRGYAPGEVAGLRQHDCYLPATGWGNLTLEVNRTEVGRKWTDSGDRHDMRGLKHRADKETREVPIPPELVSLLSWHMATFGVAPDGRLFVSPKGGVIGQTVYARVWRQARLLALSPEQAVSVLARRPCDLRHAAVSLWLNSGVPATEVAERAGQSVEVLLRIYAKCIDGDKAIMNARIEQALG